MFEVLAVSSSDLCTATVLCSSAADSVTNHESSVDVIRLDVSRTFSHLGIFQKVNLLTYLGLKLKFVLLKEAHLWPVISDY